MRKPSTLAITLIGAACLMLTGCEEISGLLEGGGQSSSDTPEEAPANVNLPAVPPLELLDVPDEYPDGTRSVIGTINMQDELMGEELKVKALVDEMYECDVPVQPEEGEDAVDAPAADADSAQDPRRPGCLRPHFYIADTERSPRRLLVTGYDYELYNSQLETGLRYTFTGSYREAAAGFSSSDGLLVVDKIEGNNISQEQPEDGEEE
jgi:hypothetical protein